MIIRVEEKKWTGLKYGLTGNMIYVNVDRIAYAEYMPEHDMTLIHLTTCRELISCAGDIRDALEDDDGYECE